MAETETGAAYRKALDALSRAQEKWSRMSSTASRSDREWANKALRRLRGNLRKAQEAAK